MRQWDHTTEETLRHLWTDLLVALVRTYRGARMKMWSRIPDMMTASARQTCSLDRWYTLTLRHLQIERQGSAGDPSSLCSTWGRVRAAILACGTDPLEVQRRALYLLREERATIIAQAMEAWEQHKQDALARRAAQPADQPADQPAEDEEEEMPYVC